MKNLKVILASIGILMSVYGYSQTNGSHLYPKDEAIAMLKENYLFMYFVNPADTVATLDRFIETIDKIVPVDREKKMSICEQAVVAVQGQTIKDQSERFSFNPKTEKFISVSFQIDRLPLTDSGLGEYIPLLGGNVNDVIRANFSDEEYTRIYKTLADERIEGTKAYYSLMRCFNYEAPEKAYGIEATLLTWNEVHIVLMFDHFKVR